MTTTIKFLQHMERQQPNKIQLQTTDINHSTRQLENEQKNIAESQFTGEKVRPALIPLMYRPASSLRYHHSNNWKIFFFYENSINLLMKIVVNYKYPHTHTQIK